MEEIIKHLKIRRSIYIKKRKWSIVRGFNEAIKIIEEIEREKKAELQNSKR